MSNNKHMSLETARLAVEFRLKALWLYAISENLSRGLTIEDIKRRLCPILDSYEKDIHIEDIFKNFSSMTISELSDLFFFMGYTIRSELRDERPTTSDNSTGE